MTSIMRRARIPDRRCVVFLVAGFLLAGAQGQSAAPRDAKPDPGSSEHSATRPLTNSGMPAPPAAAPATGREAEQLKISLEGGKLQVTAQNADLQQILARIAALSGMTIEGQVSSSRVYGSFGPENPQTVLVSLLEGSGCNYMMIGVTPLGAPRILRLSLKSGAATPPANRPISMEPAPEAETSGAGAMTQVPPPPPATVEERMQRNMQRLQHMHDTETQQSQAQQGRPQ